MEVWVKFLVRVTKYYFKHLALADFHALLCLAKVMKRVSGPGMINAHFEVRVTYQFPILFKML